MGSSVVMARRSTQVVGPRLMLVPKVDEQAAAKTLAVLIEETLRGEMDGARKSLAKLKTQAGPEDQDDLQSPLGRLIADLTTLFRKGKAANLAKTEQAVGRFLLALRGEAAS
jgi:hypothetical protein